MNIQLSDHFTYKKQLKTKAWYNIVTTTEKEQHKQ